MTDLQHIKSLHPKVFESNKIKNPIHEPAGCIVTLVFYVIILLLLSGSNVIC